jgi:UDP-N-acetylglucosamine 2-epimerase (non-hydrolysing)/GDP/UDP-N,N'-diacetylbacillosamine 2-epimerase (hydrolysing)
MSLKVCVVSGTRADYGALQPVMAALKADPAFALQVLATGTHCSPEFGMTHKAIEADGFAIDEKVEMLLSSDTRIGTAKAMGLGAIGYADALSRLAPDLVMLLGDRFEALAAASTAHVLGLPVAHISGGDLTEGAFDDAIRHAITKLSHLHFVASEEAARRVRQLGEPAERVHHVGDPGLDHLKAFTPMPREALERELGLRFRRRNFLVTYHPVTNDERPSVEQLEALLAALERQGEDVGIVVTKPNADPEGRALIARLESFAAAHDNFSLHTSLGRQRYFSVMAEVDAVVGNSSSGLLEAPSLGKPTVNVGRRQDRRLRARSVIDCPAETNAIVDAIEQALALDCRGVENPYGDGEAAPRIVAVLKSIDTPRRLLAKRFVDLPAA